MAWGIGTFTVQQAAGQAPVAIASNPKVGIRLERVTCAEAVAALEKACGLPLRLETSAPFPGNQAETERRLAERASFDWTGVTLRAALEQLVERYRLTEQTHAGGQLALYANYEPGVGGAYHPASPVEVDGYRIGVLSSRVGRVTNERERKGDLQLGLQVEPLNGDVEEVAALEDVSAVDDSGRVLVSNVPLFPGRATVLPGRWRANLEFPAPAPQALRLTKLRGKLMVYRKVTRYRAEFPLPRLGAAVPRKWREGGLQVEILEFQPGPSPAPSLERPLAGPTVSGRWEVPPNVELGHELVSPFGTHGIPAPILYGASGRSYAPTRWSSGGSGLPVQPAPTARTYHFTWTYPAIDEPVTRMVMDVLRREEPVQRSVFELKDIPLPRPDTEGTQLHYGLSPTRLEAGHPFYRKDGARLVSPVAVEGRPAPAGKLQFGLSPCRPETARGSEWFEMPVEPDGTARLSNLAAGAYRLLRIYRPDQATPSPPGSVWRGAELIVEVPERGEVVLPPLSRQAQAALSPRELQDRAHPVEPVPGEADEGRIELRETSLSVSQQRRLLFLREPLLQDHSTATVLVSGAVGRDHSDRLYALRNVVACDDRGTLTLGAGGALNQSHRLWNARLSFPVPFPGVRRLAWIEGDVHAWTRERPVRLEIPLPRSRQTVKRSAEGVSLEITLTPGAGDDELKKPNESRPRRGVSLKATLTAPPDHALVSGNGERSVIPRLVAESGESYPLQNWTRIPEPGAKGTMDQLTGEFQALDKPAARVVFEFIVKSQPRKVGAFRATDVAFPPGGEE